MTEDRKYSIVWKTVHWFGDLHHEKVNPNNQRGSKGFSKVTKKLLIDVLKWL